MERKDRIQLMNEIQHIFDSGANEIRIYDMVVSFMDRRKQEYIDQWENIKQRIENGV